MMCFEYVSDRIAGTNWVGNVAEDDELYAISNKCFKGADKFTCSLVATNSPMMLFATVAFDSRPPPSDQHGVDAFAFAAGVVYDGMSALSRDNGYNGRAELLLNFLDNHAIYDAQTGSPMSKRESDKLMDFVEEGWQVGLYGTRGLWFERFPTGDTKMKPARGRSFFGAMSNEERARSEYVQRKFQNFVDRTYCGTNLIEVVPNDWERFRLSRKRGGGIGRAVVSLGESLSPMLLEIHVTVDPPDPRSDSMEGAVMHQIADGIFDCSLRLGVMPPEVLFVANGCLYDSHGNMIDDAKRAALARRAAFQFEQGLYSRPIEEYFR